MVSEYGPRELVRRLKKDGREDGQWRWSERAGKEAEERRERRWSVEMVTRAGAEAEEGWREDGK